MDTPRFPSESIGFQIRDGLIPGIAQGSFRTFLETRVTLYAVLLAVRYLSSVSIQDPPSDILPRTVPSGSTGEYTVS